MENKIPTLTLSNGIEMPCIGQGTYPMQGSVLYNAISGAISCGCALIDTAHSYPNEKSIGDAIHKVVASGQCRRDQLFITSKIGDRLDNGMPMGYYFYNSDSCPDKDHRAVVKRQVKESLEKLRTDYIDLLLIHWPYYDCLEEIWLGMEDLYREGVARAIGVSNHKPRHIERIRKAASVLPMVNQIYFSPLNTQTETLDYCRANGIALEAYSPVMFLRKGTFAKDSAIRAICETHGKTPAQVVLRWDIQHNVIPIPKAASIDHIRANYDVFDFELSPEEMKTIDNFNEDYQYLPESVYCPGY